MQSTYLFIDGGHLRTNYRRTMLRWFNDDGKLDFKQVQQYFKADKCFYYDCLDDLKQTGETDDDYTRRVAEQNAFFDAIRAIPGCHVRLGRLTGQGKKKRQKEVDILLAVDMLNHAVRGNLLRTTLLTGDSDFKPVVDSLIQMGVFISVAGDRSQTSTSLASAADSFIPLTFVHYFEWTDRKIQQKHPIGIMEINMVPPSLPIVGTGTLNGKRVTVTMERGGYQFYIHVPNFQDDTHLCLQGSDPDRMKLYLELQYGKVEWSQ